MPKPPPFKTHTFTIRSVRYVQDCANGSTANQGNHWVEMEVYGERSTTYIGNIYEVENDVERKVYYHGSQQIAMSENGTVYYLFGDHLGSTSVTSNSAGVKQSEIRYKPFGEIRYASGVTLTRYRYTGQRQTGTVIYHCGARW